MGWTDLVYIDGRAAAASRRRVVPATASCPPATEGTARGRPPASSTRPRSSPAWLQRWEKISADLQQQTLNSQEL